ncbi:response regulator FixJ [Xanthobacter tagetidis]|jgi:two-component system response regulator FixJ|uniref:Response regulator n=1 Tax=Xanthobacter tagetidis TaxID=60216 RepID=A0A3L7A3M5_9HYPH|nr:response regulator FixJ [Xanthobacter tagetidis]MBB6308829.1 two-component system response regulator FixJ [Xanthobacter tagetidis]RLP74879.1 response regulator [Xanthobacter tagetidis]
MTETAVIHVIDDDDAVRQSLAFLLATVGYEVREHPSARAFVDAGLPAVDPAAGCIITDVRMPDMTGIDLLQHLKDKGSAVPVVVITGHGDVPLAVTAMKLGAADFLEKPFDDVAIIDVVKSALARREKTHQHDALRGEAAERIAALSQRERQVLELLVAGQANKMIAYDLGISPRTVEVYRANVMTKMKAQSLSELVRMALLAGIVPRGA